LAEARASAAATAASPAAPDNRHTALEHKAADQRSRLDAAAGSRESP